MLFMGIQVDSAMDLTLFENLTAAWKGVSGAVATQIDDGYFGKAWRTTNRSQKWHTLVQDQPCSVFTEGEDIFSKVVFPFERTKISSKGKTRIENIFEW